MKLPLLLLAALAAPLCAASVNPQPPTKVIIFTNLFNNADTDGNEILDYEEFAGSYGASSVPAITQIRFNTLSNNLNTVRARGGFVLVKGGVYLPEFIAANGGRRINPSKSQIFQAADDSGNGFLSLLEFVDTRAGKAPSEASIVKAFARLDKNDDDQISPAEYGIAVMAN